LSFSIQKAHSILAKDAPKKKQAQMRINLERFLSFSKYIPKINKRHAIKPETIENAMARFEYIS
jgi:hypothetical protein